MLDLQFAELSDKGKVRDHNEDFLGHVAPATPELARSLGWLFVLADGVGGSDKGEIASRMAVEHFTAGFPQASSSEGLSALLTRLAVMAATQPSANVR